MKRFTVIIAYTTDVVLPNDGNAEQIKKNLEAFGARYISVSLEPYVGKGEHEWVASKTFGLQDRMICVKCLIPKEKAAETCEGISE